MKNLLLFLLISQLSDFIPDSPIRIFLIGDSTMADKPIIDNPEHGWGQMLPLFFTKNVAVYNYAKNGRSTKSFLQEGRWDSVVSKLREGDYVFIQFGHNDSKKEDTSRYAAPHAEYKNNLLRYVRETREKKAIPVLITPVNRRKYNAEGKFVDQHGEYPGVVREIAKAEKVPLIDLHKSSMQLLEKLGPEESKKLFLLSVQPNVYRALPNGKDDNTHFTKAGAFQIARLVVKGIQEAGLPLEKEIVWKDISDLKGMNKVVGLDEFYNNERKKISPTVKVRYHYTWDDSLDSGFSELGKIFNREGAVLDTLQTAPTQESLQRFSVYIIVDPDTPKETEAPNYLQEKEIDVIEQWVKDGGVLVLMANDTGNVEFEHFNTLASRFGIHFNEDSKHYFRDTRKDYKLGWSTNLPLHPLFKDVNGVFIKQISSLVVNPPAKEILGENGFTIMAESRAGKGMVFAIGDPWLYNEYMDNSRLPEGFENYPSAISFVRWLCENAQGKQ